MRGPGSNGTLCPPSAQENPTPVSYMHYNIKLGEETCQKTFIWNRNHQKAERHKRGTPFRLWGVVRCRPARSINHWRRWRPPDQNARHINHSSTIYSLRHLPNPLTRKLTSTEHTINRSTEVLQSSPVGNRPRRTSALRSRSISPVDLRDAIRCGRRNQTMRIEDRSADWRSLRRRTEEIQSQLRRGQQTGGQRRWPAPGDWL